MRKPLVILVLTLTLLGLLLSACGPSGVQNIQPIKFEHLQRDGSSLLASSSQPQLAGTLSHARLDWLQRFVPPAA